MFRSLLNAVKYFLILKHCGYTLNIYIYELLFVSRFEKLFNGRESILIIKTA